MGRLAIGLPVAFEIASRQLQQTGRGEAFVKQYKSSGLTQNHLYGRHRTSLAEPFRKANLVALRELPLRQMVEQVNVDMQTARLGGGVSLKWP